MTFYESDNPNGFRTGQRFSVDEPSLTVMADGLGGDSLGHWHLVEEGGRPMPEPTAPSKPPYRVPSMAEIAALPWNGLAVASTFAGCGGSCLGYRMAGYRVVWASEFVPIACESYRANAPETILDTRDIRQVTADEVLAATGLGRGELDLLDGSPPCQPFSTAGKRHKSWGQVREYGDHRQRADDLFFEYVRLLEGLQPRCFVAENVSGLVKGTAKGYFKRILAALEGAGYVVQARLLDAQWLGVPQARQRIIFVGVREDLDLSPAFPTPLPYRYSVRDALPWITRGKYGPDWLSADAPSPTRSATLAYSAASNHQGLELVEVTLTGDGQAHAYAGGLDDPAGTVRAGRVVGVEQRVIHDTSGQWGAGDITDRPAPTVSVGAGSVNSHHFQVHTGPARRAWRAEPDDPSPTVLQNGSGWSDIAVTALRTKRGDRPLDGPALTVQTHNAPYTESEMTFATGPVERRKFTIAELRRICAFPDDFVLCGSYAEQWARLGNAVPPVMMRHVAETIRDGILLPARGG